MRAKVGGVVTRPSGEEGRGTPLCVAAGIERNLGWRTGAQV